VLVTIQREYVLLFIEGLSVPKFKLKTLPPIPALY
jgi:hypothetical protein